MAVPAPAILEAAQEAGLRYTSDDGPGIRRRRAGRGFAYVAPSGSAITDETEIRRIKRLAIPPAWTDVWISADPRGHIQATGRDARGRKQYRYHERFRAVRDENKYGRMLEFARSLPKIRQRVDADLRSPKLNREKVLATVVRLLEVTLIRVGNEEYARANRHFGLTTLREHHLDVSGSRVRFRFTGKSGKVHDVELTDGRVARVMRRLQELPGQELFRWIDSRGVAHRVDSDDVNAYIREVAGTDFSAKDFRTWAGTVLVAQLLSGCPAVENVRYARRNVTTAITAAAERLGNTPAICRKAYVHPAIVDAYLSGELPRITGESAVLRFLERRLVATPKAA